MNTLGTFDFVLPFEAVEMTSLMTSVMTVMHFTIIGWQSLAPKCHTQLHVFLTDELEVAYHREMEFIRPEGDFELRGGLEKVGAYRTSLI